MESFTKFRNKLVLAYKKRDNQEISRLLNERREKLNEKSECNKLLVYACSIGNKEIVELMIKHGANVGKMCSKDKNALTFAYENGHRHLFEILISNGANFNTPHGSRLLLENCERQKMGDLVLLLQHGASQNVYGPNRMTPLMIASKKGFIQKVRLLLTNSSTGINLTNKNGMSSLYLACLNNHPEVARLLLEKGADLNYKIKSETALMMACRKNHLRVVELFVEYGADVFVITKKGHTCLSVAYEHKNEQIVKLLVKKQPNLLSEDKEFLVEVVRKTI